MPDADELTVQLHDDAGVPERLWILARVGPGLVRVREWSPLNWSTLPEERVESDEAVWQAAHRAHEARRRVTPDLSELRGWLDRTRR
jgi:hypothetical protein